MAVAPVHPGALLAASSAGGYLVGSDVGEAIDVLRPDICLNGITQIRRMAALAETYSRIVREAAFEVGVDGN